MNAREIADDVQQTVAGCSNSYRTLLQQRIKYYGVVQFFRGLLMRFRGKRQTIRAELRARDHVFTVEAKEAIIFTVHAADENDALMQVMMYPGRNITEIDSVKQVGNRNRACLNQ